VGNGMVSIMKHLYILLVIPLLLGGGCNMFWEDYGDEGQPCAEDNTCRSGLICQAGTCVAMPDGDRDMVSDMDLDNPEVDTDDPPVDSLDDDPAPDGDLESDPPVDTDPDPVDPDVADPDIVDVDGVVDFGPGTVQRSFPAPSNSCKGLALDGDTLWVGDATNNEYVQLSISDGGEDWHIDLPLAQLKDFDIYLNKLFAAFNTGNPEIRIVDLESSILSNAVTQTYGTFKGLTFRGTELITWEGNTVKKRLAMDQSQQAVYVCNVGGDMLTHTGDVYYSYLESPFDGSRFTLHIQKLDATHAVNVTVLDNYYIPIDAQKVTGMDARENKLYIMTAGSGTQANRIFEIQWK